MSVRIGDGRGIDPDDTEIDPELRRLVERSRRPGALSLWNVLGRGEREAATRWFVEVEDGGRRKVDEAVAAARRFRPQTVRGWSLERVARSMSTVSLQEPALAQVILLHSACAPDRLPMVRSFLDDLGIPHQNGEVDSLKQLDASPYALGKVASGMVEEYGDRTVAVYFLVLRLAGTTLGEKSCAWLKERWRVGGPEDGGAEGAAARGYGPEGRDAGSGAPADNGGHAAEGRGPDAATVPPGDAVEAEVPREEDREPGPGGPPGRGWEPASREGSLTTLDRVVKGALEDGARGTLGALNESEIDAAVAEFITLNGTRHESYFHPGYRDVLFGRDVGLSLRTEHPARLRWYWAGAVAAWAMRERWGRIAAQYDDNPVVRELATGSSAASAAALLPIVKALSRVGRSAEIGRSASDDALLRQPRLFPELLAAATDLLRDGDAAHARHILEVLDRSGGVLEDRGVAPPRRDLLDARRRFAHSLRMLREHERARQLLEDLLEQDPDPNTHAMVHADLGLMQGRFDSLTDVALPDRRTAAERVRDRLAGGEEHFRQSVREAAEYSAHGHYCLGVLALGRAVSDDVYEEAERHLQRARTHFSETADYPGSLVARANLYFGIAKAQQLSPDKLAHAADVTARAVRSGARFPSYLIGQTVEAFGLADDKSDLRRVAEAIIETGGDEVLDELGGSETALDHCPALADRLHARAADDNRRGDARAADLRAALRGFLHRNDPEAAGRALDGLEGLARQRVAVEEFLTLLADRTRYEPAWDLDDATIARARCHETRGEYREAVAVLRDLFHRLASWEGEAALDDASGILQRIRRYGIDRSEYSDMTSRYDALAADQVEPVAPGESARSARVRVLVVGGGEQQARTEEIARKRMRERHPHIRAAFVRTGWSANWERTLADVKRRMARHDALVIVRFMRTNLGREIRRHWSGPWRSCWSGGPGAIVDAVARAAAMARIVR